jgi:O-antigen ligase
VWFAGPESVRDRMRSIVRPRGTVDSNLHRVVTWRTGVAMIRANPLTGVGPQRVGLVFDQYVPADVPRPLPVGWYGHLHSIYLQTAAERGLPALVLLLAMIGQALWRFARPGTPPWLRHGATAALIAVLVSGITEHNLGDSEVLMMTLSVMALASSGPALGRPAAG